MIDLSRLKANKPIPHYLHFRYIYKINQSYVPGLYILFFPMVRNGIVHFCSVFLDEPWQVL